jgi:hypothetical protein
MGVIWGDNQGLRFVSSVCTFSTLLTWSSVAESLPTISCSKWKPLSNQETLWNCICVRFELGYIRIYENSKYIYPSTGPANTVHCDDVSIS